MNEKSGLALLGPVVGAILHLPSLKLLRCIGCHCGRNVCAEGRDGER